jgi:hypothetical protein
VVSSWHRLLQSANIADKPNSHESQPSMLAQSPSNQDIYWRVALLSSPLWGTALTVLLMCRVSWVFFYVGILFVVAGVLPIILANIKGIKGVIVKIVLCAVYFFIGSFVMLFVTWKSICEFCLDCK